MIIGVVGKNYSEKYFKLALLSQVGFRNQPSEFGTLTHPTLTPSTNKVKSAGGYSLSLKAKNNKTNGWKRENMRGPVGKRSLKIVNPP